MRRHAQAGQIMPMVALLMVVILGMAAFAIDGSNIYSQHRRIQADLDVAVKVAAADLFNTGPANPADATTAQYAIAQAAQLLTRDGYNNTISFTTSVDPVDGHTKYCGSSSTGGVTIQICTPPTRGPYVYASTSSQAHHYDYVEGVLGVDVGGFFGGVLGLGKVHISARAVGWHGGYKEVYALMGLDPNDPCAILVPDAGSSLDAIGNSYSATTSCKNSSNGATVANVSDMSCPASGGPSQCAYSKSGSGGGSYSPIAGQTGTDYGVPYQSDPNPPINLGSLSADSTLVPYTTPSAAYSYAQSQHCDAQLLAALHVSSSTALPTGTYYFAPDPSSSYEKIDLGVLSSGTYYLLPPCTTSAWIGSAASIYGIYDFYASGGTAHPTGNSTIESFDSVVYMDANAHNTGNSSWILQAPTNGPYQGIAFSQHSSDPQPPCDSTITNLTVEGNSSTSTPTTGVIDAPCANITLNGNSTTAVDGAVVGYTVTASGSSSTIVNYDPGIIPAIKGSVLVE